MAFTHLHVHTEYSLLDGAARIGDLVARAKELGMTSLAITDHGVMFGVIDFYRECKKQGIRPVIGCEVYTAARTLFDKDAERDKRMGHLVLLAKNNQGYKNLMKIVSEGYRHGFYYKPRIDKNVLRQYHEGLIALSACLAGEIPHRLLNGDYEGAKKEALEMLDIFGEGNFYLELQDQGLEEEARILPDMKRLHAETGIPFVATNDSHYVRQEDAVAQDILMCIQMGTTVDEENRMRFSNDQFYLKSEDEMRKIFASIPEACDNTEKIAQQCDVTFTFGELHLPDFQAPEGLTKPEYLRKLCEKGLAERYPEAEGEDLADLQERLNYELSTIENMGYVEYFLIVWDFINYAKENHIMVGPGRGSAAGSIVAYTLRITDIDPIKYGLIFERFLNPERVSMPDIDIDFCYERRGEVIDYVTRKYGEDKVSQIITFGTMKAKQAVRDVGRVLNVSYPETDAIAKAIPFALKMTIDKALEMSPELKAKYEGDETTRKVIDMARAIEGMPRHASTHAAGVVISRDSIDEYVPLYLADKGLSTQFNMTTIEELGLLKMDFLGLRNLTIIRDALAMIEKDHGVKIDFSRMEYDDPKVYEIIAKGNTEGIFQLESGGMTQFMKNLKPDCFEDIVAGISLYRPGPMDFIPILENSKEIIRVGKWVIDQSLQTLARWREQIGHMPLKRLQINVSYVQFKDPELLGYVVERLDHYQLPHDAVMLELTESCRVEQTSFLSDVLQTFKDAGISIALDDFGTGYASLTVLKDIPADMVKLDHTMTRSITEKPKDKALIEFIVTYCKKVGIAVCAEGVEKVEALSIVRNAGVECIQGYYYDKPLELDTFYRKYVK